MAIVIPPGFANVALHFVLTGDPEDMLITFGVDSSATPDPNALAFDISAAWASAWPASDMESNWSFLGATTAVGQDGGPPNTGEDHTHDYGGAGTGTQTLPSNCAFLVKKVTSLGGRANQGRFYLPPAFGQEVDVDALGIISPAAVASLQGNLSDFFANLSPTPMVILHDASSPVMTPTAVANLQLQSLIATQRRRLRR